jgi:hypothetical protein
MLQTITRRKIEYLFRSRNWTDDERRRIRRVEDMLFGAVFGMLDYVDETTQRQMLRLLLPWKQYPELQDVADIGKITRARFWPRFPDSVRNSVEPDALVSADL